MTTALPFGPQTIGQAEKALNAILLRELSGTGLDERGWVTLTLALRAEPGLELDTFTDRLASSLHSGAEEARAAVAGLIGRGMLERDGEVLRVAPAARELHAQIRAAIAPITERLWGDLPPADLAAAGRVLEIVRERAGVELSQPAARPPR
jgi:hypothetical protein